MTEPFPDPRTLLKQYGLAAKKSFGQNFLVAESVYRAITDATISSDSDWVVELGGGLGTLSMRLAQRLPEGKLFIVERDRDMVAVLRDQLGHLDGVEIIEQDAVRYDLGMVARWHGAPITLCGNLPYNIASQLLFRVVDHRDCVSRAVFMIQREMAQRVLAQPSTKAYGAMTVMLRAYLDASVVRRVVKPTAFVPPPKVESSVVCLTPLPGGEPRVPLADAERFAAVVRAGFAQRRKTLRNSLKTGFDAADIDRMLEAAAIDGSRRAETLDVAEFAALANA